MLELEVGQLYNIDAKTCLETDYEITVLISTFNKKRYEEEDCDHRDYKNIYGLLFLENCNYNGSVGDTSIRTFYKFFYNNEFIIIHEEWFKPQWKLKVEKCELDYPTT